MLKHLLTAALLAGAAPAPLAAQAFDPSPWIEDLEQMRQAFREKYANREWIEQERELKLDPLFDQAAAAISKAPNEAAVRSMFDRLPAKLSDGHVRIEWPRPAAAGTAATASPPAPELCRGLGYDARQSQPGTAIGIPGYQPLASDAESPFAAGMITSGATKVGVLRVGVFQPQGYPRLCREAAAELSIPADKPCDESCEDKITTLAYRRLTEALEDRVRQLKEAGATVLLVDISDNGGGSDWVEAAARIMSPKQLVSERRGFVRGEHWARQWRNVATGLREQARKASPADKARLLAWAKEADAAILQAQTACATADCRQLATAGYSTGLVGSAPSGAFAGKDWGVLVFNPAQFPYHDGVWSGPLIVLVDQETWSAAEEFAAVLQDNRAAVVIGARTGGAGCGYTYGGTPTKLKNSGAILKLPDCVRFRADGSNEVSGIIPDVPVAIRADDGLRFRARLISDRLPEAISRAQALQAQLELAGSTP